MDFPSGGAVVLKKDKGVLEGEQGVRRRLEDAIFQANNKGDAATRAAAWNIKYSIIL